LHSFTADNAKSTRIIPLLLVVVVERETNDGRRSINIQFFTTTANQPINII